MISLQSHNQVLFHLSQLTTVIPPISTPFLIQVKQTDSGLKNNEDNFLCQNNFLEATKSYNELGIQKLNIQNLLKPLIINKNDTWEILGQASKNKLAYIQYNNYNTTHFDKLIVKCNKWSTSFISANSFIENKRGLSSHESINIREFLTINCLVKPKKKYIPKLCSQIIYSNKAQVRYFKTDRTIKTEYTRNPTLSTRIRKWIGFSIQPNDKLIKMSNGTHVISTTREQKDIEKLRNVQDNKCVSMEELQRIKAAFAEGYLAGYNHKPHVKGFKALKVVQQVISTFILVALVIAIVATTGGSMFKIQIGNRIQVDPEEIHVTFNDVKGVEEAKLELMDIVEFLRNPDKFSALGGKLPKGVLLVGPPGTGKTLLARAVAGEAGVPFFHAAGPEFDEILVGQGARRVRDLFKAAKERAPCVIFIDEIDSVGSKRTNSALHPYANQTINQLLSEMDGFHQNEGVIVLGATNRRQDLDKALLRPGRFDSEITVHVPDFSGRKEILDLYLGRILTNNVNAELLAKCTIGFTGADIENMINQAALRAAIEGAEFVTMNHLERARDKVIMGPEGKKKMLDEEENRITAYHEGGHALVSYFTKEATPLHKVTIIPRGQSLGHTSYLPHKDAHYMTKAQMLATMDSCMGGRAAEELIFGRDKVTSGASNDFLNATEIAEAMVKIYGMSEKVGFRVHRDPGENGSSTYSSGTKELIDNEIKRILQESYERAKTILRNHSKEHKILAEALLKYETLDAEDVKTLLSGKKLRFETTNDLNRTVVDIPNNVM